MHRRRSALTVSAAAALVVAAPLLTACGSDSRPGAAAVVDGERITMAQLQSRVKEVRDAQREQPDGERLVASTGRLTRGTLDAMIRQRIVEKVAEDSGVNISRSELQQIRAQFQGRPGGGGEKGLEKGLLLDWKVAPSQIDDWMWLQAAVREIAQAEGIDLGSPEGNAAMTAKFADAGKKMDVDVNPRYGEWDVQAAMLGDTETPWLKDLSGEKKDRAQEQQPA